jgi:hypothetical protein
MTIDVTSLFARMSSTQWGGWMTPATFGSLNIGGIATGSFDQTTNAFNISWTHAFTGVPFLTSGNFSLKGQRNLQLCRCRLRRLVVRQWATRPCRRSAEKAQSQLI